MKAPSNIYREILVVEDNVLLQKLMIEYLKKLGYSARVASGGHHALELFREKNCELIFMDMNLPDMDGAETAKKIREESQGFRPVIIGLTAGKGSQHKRKCIEGGMDDCLFKPLSIEKLKMCLLESLSSAPSKKTGPSSDFPDHQIADDLMGKILERENFSWDLLIVEDLIDLQTIEEIRTFDDKRQDLTVFQRLYKLFVEEAEKTLVKIDQFWKEKSFSALEKEVHYFKGACIQIGAKLAGRVLDSPHKKYTMAPRLERDPLSSFTAFNIPQKN